MQRRPVLRYLWPNISTTTPACPGAKAVMLLKLDIISCLNYAWREAHNKMLLRHSIALDCLRRKLPPIDDDQKLALLHAPFKGTMLFGGELAKLQEANTKRAATFTVFLQPTGPLHLILLDRMSDEVEVSLTEGAIRNLAGDSGDRAGPRLPPRVPNHFQYKEGQTAMKVSVPLDSKKHKVEPQDNTPQTPRKTKRNFRGDKNQGKKQ